MRIEEEWRDGQKSHLNVDRCIAHNVYYVTWTAR